MEKIVVLMSTYNGEKYLKAQIDSILAQEGIDVFLLVRDDGSKDSTKDILRDYSCRYNNVEILEEENSGVIWSFYKLLEYAKNNCGDFKYFAFSDQDDYWYPDKLYRAISMNKNNSDNYLYHSCYDIVDEELNIIAKSYTSHCVGSLGEALITNPSIGCSEVFTYKIVEQSAKICNYVLEDKKYYPYHDLWVYLVALANKADIVFDDYCGLQYRQHGSNVIGTGMSRLETIKLQYRNLKSTKKLKSGFGKIMLDLYQVDDDVKNILESACHYRKCLWRRLKLMNDRRFYVKDIVRRLAFKYTVLMGLY